MRFGSPPPARAARGGEGSGVGGAEVQQAKRESDRRVVRRLVIEVDGGGHGDDRQARHDADRTAYLNSEGYRVLRFWNNEVLNEIDGVMSAIYAALHDAAGSAPPTPDPSPPRAARAGGGERRR